MMDIAIFLLNNTASYSKESSVDKLYVSIFAICKRIFPNFHCSLDFFIKWERELAA